MSLLTSDTLSLSDQIEMRAKEASIRQRPAGGVFFVKTLTVTEMRRMILGDESPIFAEIRLVGLAESLKERAGFSNCVSQSVQRNEPSEPGIKTYLKNDILVGHAGRRITSEDVANALAEE